MDKAVNHFVDALNLNYNDQSAKSNLINIFNIKKPKNINHPLIELNDKIVNIKYDNKIDNILTDRKIKTILEKGNEFLNQFDENYIQMRPKFSEKFKQFKL